MMLALQMSRSRGTPLFAKASDRSGRRGTLLACVTGFGLGASGIFPVAATVIGDSFPEEKRGSALGLLGIAVAITNLDTGHVAASLGSPAVWPFALAGAACLPLWWRVEQRAADPVVRPSFFRSRQLRIVMVIAAGIGTVECTPVFFPALGAAALGVSESTAACLMLPGVFVMVVVSPLAGRLVDRVARPGWSASAWPPCSAPRSATWCWRRPGPRTGPPARDPAGKATEPV
jgi:MFS family permease